jgi:peptide/nickel transport system permease protein
MSWALPRPATRRLSLRIPCPGLTLAGIVLGLAAATVIWPSAFAGDPLAADPLRVLEGPSAAHWFGTGQLGRDVFDRVVHGARHSLNIGVAATVIAVGAGILLGLLAGLTHRTADEALNRTFDALSAFPLVLLALLFIAIGSTGTTGLVVAIGIATTPHCARVVRPQALVVRCAPYVTHAVAFGTSRPAWCCGTCFPTCSARSRSWRRRRERFRQERHGPQPRRTGRSACPRRSRHVHRRRPSCPRIRRP